MSTPKVRQTFGGADFYEKERNEEQKYSPEFKISIMLDMQNNHLGYREVVRKFWNTNIDNPIDEQIHLREVVRCIRPAVEGVYRLKYFNYISDTNWLGDFIKLIRDSNESSPMFRLKDILEDIEDIKDYSKIYHHSNPTYLEAQISAKELKVDCQKTIEVIESI